MIGKFEESKFGDHTLQAPSPVIYESYKPEDVIVSQVDLK